MKLAWWRFTRLLLILNSHNSTKRSRSWRNRLRKARLLCSTLSKRNSARFLLSHTTSSICAIFQKFSKVFTSPISDSLSLRNKLSRCGATKWCVFSMIALSNLLTKPYSKRVLMSKWNKASKWISRSTAAQMAKMQYLLTFSAKESLSMMKFKTLVG